MQMGGQSLSGREDLSVVTSGQGQAVQRTEAREPGTL